MLPYLPPFLVLITGSNGIILVIKGCGWLWQTRINLNVSLYLRMFPRIGLNSSARECPPFLWEDHCPEQQQLFKCGPASCRYPQSLRNAEGFEAIKEIEKNIWKRMLGLIWADMKGLNSSLQKQEVSHQLSKSTGFVPKQFSLQNCFVLREFLLGLLRPLGMLLCRVPSKSGCLKRGQEYR